MNGRRLLVLLIAAAAIAFYLYNHRSGASREFSSGGAPASANTSPGNDCLARTEEADREVSAAASLISRPPFDENAWQSAEGSALSAISSAESGCGSTSDAKEREAVVELRAALVGMRSLMRELSSAAKGTGGASEGPRLMEDIENHIEKARSLLR